MNAGIVASRYAKALLKFVLETGNGDKVYAQAGVLALRMHIYFYSYQFQYSSSALSHSSKLSLFSGKANKYP